MSTLLIAGGHVVDEERVRRADVLIRDGTIAGVLEPGHAAASDDVLDATGLHVLPGLVDAHVHFNDPGRADWEGFATGTAAAAAGGVTTVCDMPLNCHPPTLDGRALALKRAAIADQAVVDYALWGGVVPESLAHLGDFSQSGVIGVKAFLCDSGLPEYRHLDGFGLLDAAERCAELGLLLALHAEDAARTHELGAAARAAGRNGPLDWARARPPETEVDAVRWALATARETGVRMHFVHLSTGDAARLVASARADGLDVTGETCPHYLALDESDLERLGTRGKCAPPLRSREVVDDLWQAVLEGAIDFVASDHSPCPPAMKDTPDIWSAWGGLAGVQTTLSVMLTEGCERRQLGLPQLVRLLCANPARRVGLAPRKGTLAPGADADLALVDLDAAWTPRESDLETRWPLNPFLGRTLHGRVRATLLRGTRVYADGSVLAPAGAGRPA